MSFDRPRIDLKAGTDRSIRLAVRNADNSARDLTGEVIEFRAAPGLNSASALIYKSDGDGIEMIDAETGLIDLVFTRVETRLIGGSNLFFELRLTDIEGEVTILDFSDNTIPKTWGLLVVEKPLLLAG